MVKEGEASEFLRPSYIVAEDAKDADAKLLNQKKGAQGRYRELRRKGEEHRQLKHREGRGGEVKRTKVKELTRRNNPESYGKCFVLFF